MSKKANGYKKEKYRGANKKCSVPGPLFFCIFLKIYGLSRFYLKSLKKGSLGNYLFNFTKVFYYIQQRHL
jgi:hypothetical protein